jgi:hypothetical protein
MFDLEEFKKFIGQFITKFFTIITGKFNWTAKAADPFFKDCACNNEGRFIWDSNNFSIFCEGVGHTEDKCFPMGASAKGAHEVDSNTLVKRGALGHRREKGGFRSISCAAYLAAGAG